MKKILGFTLLIVMSLPSNAQSLKCTLASDTILIGDSVLVEFENATCRDIYVSIALEKKIGEHWILYSRDVMVNSFSKLSVQNIVKKHKEKSIAFQLQDRSSISLKRIKYTSGSSGRKAYFFFSFPDTLSEPWVLPWYDFRHDTIFLLPV